MGGGQGTGNVVGQQHSSEGIGQAFGIIGVWECILEMMKQGDECSGFVRVCACISG